MSYAGLIAAASGQLDVLLKKSVGKKASGYSIGKGVSGLSPQHRYGNINVGSFDGIFSNGNGLHV